jgi:hypothetical protein
MVLFALVGVALALFVIAIKPKLGTYLIWLILFTYPHGWWYHRQFLPLNIGVDDLFCIFLFVVVLIRRNLLGGIEFRFNYAFWTITAFTVIAAVANIAGSMEGEPVERIAYVKDILKLGVYWALFYAVLHCIDDERDLKMQFTMFCLAAVVGGLIVIGQSFRPYQFEIFLGPITIRKGGLQYAARASGAFMNPNSAACVLASSSALLITAVRLQRTAISKIVLYSSMFVLLIAVLMTRSRSGLIALVGMFALMAVVSRSKKVAWLVIISALIVSASLPRVRGLYKERIVEVYEPATGRWGANVHGRFETWSTYLETATAKDYLLGQGFRQGTVEHGRESHSVYVSLLTVYSIWGAFWALIALVIFWRKCFVLKNAPDPFMATVARGCMWGLVAWGIYGLASDAISAQYPRYVLFYLVVLLDRTSNIAYQQQEYLLYDEQASQAFIYPETAEAY